MLGAQREDEKKGGKGDATCSAPVAAELGGRQEGAERAQVAGHGSSGGYSTSSSPGLVLKKLPKGQACQLPGP